jgi:hypothetical protein
MVCRRYPFARLQIIAFTPHGYDADATPVRGYGGSMTKTFTGDVLLPGEAGGGLAATLSLDPERVTLTSGDSQLGSWDRSDYVITPEQNGSFNLTLGGESVLFCPDSPSDFAAVSEVPLAETVSSRAQHIRPLIKDDDAYLDELVANVKPIRNPLENGGISNAFVVVMVVLALVISVAAVVTATLV